MSQEADTSLREAAPTTSLSAGDILRGRSQLNRHLYQKRITGVAETQQEQQQPTNYLNFDATTGLARLQSPDGNIVYGSAQTNGAIGQGDTIRLRRGGVLAKYDEMPYVKKISTPNQQPPKLSKGFLFFLDKDILNISYLIDESENIKTFEGIFKYFAGSKKKVYTLKYDSRFIPSTGLIQQDGRPPSSVLSSVVSNLNLEIIEIDLSVTSKIETFLYLQLPSLNGDNTGGDFSRLFTKTEKTNLLKIASSKGLIAVGECANWENYNNYLLNVLNLNNRIKVTSPFGERGFYLNSNKSIIKNYIGENRLFYDATSIFQGARNSEVVMTAQGQPSMILVKNL
jgi:hypothetical protein